jgi:hypothetical protein
MISARVRKELAVGESAVAIVAGHGEVETNRSGKLVSAGAHADRSS